MSVAVVMFDDAKNAVTLESLQQSLAGLLKYKIQPGEWKGFGMVVPQLWVETQPPIAIQLNRDPSYVPEEIQEFVADAEAKQTLKVEQVSRLRQFRSRIEFTTCLPDQITSTKQGGLIRFESNDVDPMLPQIDEVIRAVATLLDGFAYDSQNGRWIVPEL